MSSIKKILTFIYEAFMKYNMRYKEGYTSDNPELNGFAHTYVCVSDGSKIYIIIKILSNEHKKFIL